MNSKVIFLLIVLAIAVAEGQRYCGWDCPTEGKKVCGFDYHGKCVNYFENGCEMRKVNCVESGRFRGTNPAWCESLEPYPACEDVSGQ